MSPIFINIIQQWSQYRLISQDMIPCFMTSLASRARNHKNLFEFQFKWKKEFFLETPLKSLETSENSNLQHFNSVHLQDLNRFLKTRIFPLSELSATGLCAIGQFSLPSISASSTDLKRIQIQHSLGADKTLTTRWSSGIVKFESKKTIEGFDC